MKNEKSDIRHEHSKKNKKTKPMQKWTATNTCIVVVCCLLIFAVCFVYLIYNTTFVLDVDDSSVAKVRDNVIRVTTIKEVLENEEQNRQEDGGYLPPISGNGISGNTPPLPIDPGTIDPHDPNQVELAIYQFLKGRGYSDIACAGIMGTVKYESGGYNPGSTYGHTHDFTSTAGEIAMGHGPGSSGSTGAHGLCQWLGGRCRNLMGMAQNMGMEWYEIPVQFAHWATELDNNYYARNVSPANVVAGGDGSYEYVCWKYTRYFEVPGGGDTYATRASIPAWATRLQNSAEVYAKITTGVLHL